MNEQDSRQRHLDAVAGLPRYQVIRAVEWLRHWFKSTCVEVYIQHAHKDPDWWIPCHHAEMRAARNALRSNGFGEKEFGTDNLDDYAVGLVELAWGITHLPAEVTVVGKSIRESINDDGGPWAVSDMFRVGGKVDYGQLD